MHYCLCYQIETILNGPQWQSEITVCDRTQPFLNVIDPNRYLDVRALRKSLQGAA
jgi:hypothetical protein